MGSPGGRRLLLAQSVSGAEGPPAMSTTRRVCRLLCCSTHSCTRASMALTRSTRATGTGPTTTVRKSPSPSLVSTTSTGSTSWRPSTAERVPGGSVPLVATSSGRRGTRT